MKKATRAESGLTAGVDLGDRWSRYCLLDEQGRILEPDTIALGLGRCASVSAICKRLAW